MPEIMSANPALLPPHGKVPCTKCFPDRPTTWGRAVLSRGQWQLEHNPIAWGGRNPLVMVLGFSKGDRQCAQIRAGANIDAIPFARMRPNLTAILRKLGLLEEGRTVDEVIAGQDQDFHFGSLVRCSLAKLDPHTGKAVKAGDVIAATAKDPVGREIVRNCAEEFLARLPSRLRIVVLLSNDDAWIENCFQIVRKLHPHTLRLNDVAYRSGQVTWVHVVHPSVTSGRHIPAWLNGSEGKQGRKGKLASEAVRSPGAQQFR